MNDQFSREVIDRLARIETHQRHVIDELAEVKTIAAGNRTSIQIAKGGAAFASLLATLVGILSYFRF